MSDKVQTNEIKVPAVEGAAPGAAAAPAPGTPPAPRRGPGHRGADVRDTVAEMTEKAQQLSLEAGSKVSGAMKDVIYAAAGMTGFAIESARDLLQYMVRRGQMRNEEAEKLLREVEEAHATRKPGTPHPAPRPAAPYTPKPASPAAPPPSFKAPQPHSAAILAAAPKSHEKAVPKSVPRSLAKAAGKSAQAATKPAARSAPTKAAKPASKAGASKSAKPAKKAAKKR